MNLSELNLDVNTYTDARLQKNFGLADNYTKEDVVGATSRLANVASETLGPEEEIAFNGFLRAAEERLLKRKMVELSSSAWTDNIGYSDTNDILPSNRSLTIIPEQAARQIQTQSNGTGIMSTVAQLELPGRDLEPQIALEGAANTVIQLPVPPQPQIDRLPQANPLHKNIASRIILIDSQYRQHISSDSNNVTTTDPKNPKPSFNTDFTLDLSEPLKKVVSLKLYSIQIPTTWYTFDDHLGNTVYEAVYEAVNDGTSVSTHHKITPGNYDIEELNDEVVSSVGDIEKIGTTINPQIQGSATATLIIDGTTIDFDSPSGYTNITAHQAYENSFKTSWIQNRSEISQTAIDRIAIIEGLRSSYIAANDAAAGTTWITTYYTNNAGLNIDHLLTLIPEGGSTAELLLDQDLNIINNIKGKSYIGTQVIAGTQVVAPSDISDSQGAMNNGTYTDDIATYLKNSANATTPFSVSTVVATTPGFKLYTLTDIVKEIDDAGISNITAIADSSRLKITKTVTNTPAITFTLTISVGTENANVGFSTDIEELNDEVGIITIDAKTQKTTINNNAATSLIFFKEGGFEEEEGVIGGQYINQNLGWNLGFRPTTSDKPFSSTVSDATVDVYGPKYFTLALDDFNQNHQNKGLVSLTDNHGPISVVKTSAKYDGGKALTKAQKFSDNQKITARDDDVHENDKYKAPGPRSTSDAFAMVPLKGIIELRERNEPFVEYGPSLQSNVRTYSSPVDIERLRIRLFDDKGNLVNLHDNDWSFSLVVEQEI